MRTNVEVEVARLRKCEENLQWLVLYCLSLEHPPISIGKGKELLGFKYMDDMRNFMNKYYARKE